MLAAFKRVGTDSKSSVVKKSALYNAPLKSPVEKSMFRRRGSAMSCSRVLSFIRFSPPKVGRPSWFEVKFPVRKRPSRGRPRLPSSFLAKAIGPEMVASAKLYPYLSSPTLWSSPMGRPELMTSAPPNHLELEFLKEMLMTPPVTSPMLAGIPPVITLTSSIALFGRALDPRTLTPSM